MAQITDHISLQDADIFYSTDGSSWTEISGEANSITADGFERAYGETATFEGAGPLVKTGKAGSGTVTARVAYRENASGLYAIALTAFTNATALYLRWIPKGATQNNYRFTTSSGLVLRQPLPTGSAESGDVAMIDIAVRCGSVTKDAVP